MENYKNEVFLNLLKAINYLKEINNLHLEKIFKLENEKSLLISENTKLKENLKILTNSTQTFKEELKENLLNFISSFDKSFEISVAFEFEEIKKTNPQTEIHCDHNYSDCFKLKQENSKNELINPCNSIDSINNNTEITMIDSYQLSESETDQESLVSDYNCGEINECPRNEIEQYIYSFHGIPVTDSILFNFRIITSTYLVFSWEYKRNVVASCYCTKKT